MKRFFCIWCAMMMAIFTITAQEYTISGAGTGRNGHYLVHVKVNVKKAKMTSEDQVRQCAVDGVMFRGFMSQNGSLDQKPLVSDANVKTTKADFFKQFEEEGAYNRYASIVPGTLSVMKNKRLKCQEINADVLIDQDSLRKYLESSGIITGFSNLW